MVFTVKIKWYKLLVKNSHYNLINLNVILTEVLMVLHRKKQKIITDLIIYLYRENIEYCPFNSHNQFIKKK